MFLYNYLRYTLCCAVKVVCRFIIHVVLIEKEVEVKVNQGNYLFSLTNIHLRPDILVIIAPRCRDILKYPFVEVVLT